MIAIINIKLNNTRINPNIRTTVWSPKPTADIEREEKMNTPMQTPTNAALSGRAEPSASRALASLLLAGGVATLVVLADQLMESWAERHVVAAWLALWAIAVAAIVVLRGATRALARHTMQGLDAWSAHVAERRADRRLWAMAQEDPRLMSDLRSALDRDEDGPAQNLVTLSQRRAERIVRNRLYHI
jgi:hypothetical protein